MVVSAVAPIIMHHCNATHEAGRAVPASPSHSATAVIIATCGRPELLGDVALPSVLRQTVAPDAVVVIDDSQDMVTRGKTSSAVWQHKEAFCALGTELCLLQNSRATGASGAWNTGILHIMQKQQHVLAAGHTGTDPCASTFIAILDDDDCWEPHHIQACLSALQKQQHHISNSPAAPAINAQSHAVATDHGACMVVSGIIRHSTPSQAQPSIPANAGRKQSLPPGGALHADQFYSSNPHIQGSNLFCRLDVLLASGLFNEWLPATTDRDLCIRLAQQGVKFVETGIHTVHHFAPAVGSSYQAQLSVDHMVCARAGGRPAMGTAGGITPLSSSAVPRLSDPGGSAKHIGLHRFYHDLWGPFMTPQQHSAAVERAAQLFGVGLLALDRNSLCGTQTSQLQATSPTGGSGPLSITMIGQLQLSKDLFKSSPSGHDGAATPAAPTIANCQPIVLLVGIVSSSGATVQGLLHDLLQLMKQTEGDQVLGGLEVLLLENGGKKSAGLHPIVPHFQEQGLPVHFISRARQMQHAAAGLVPADLASRLADDEPTRPCSRLPIGDMRTLLQLHMAAVLGGMPQRVKDYAVVWVLDDDKRLLRDSTDPHRLDTSFLCHLQQLKASKAADVVLGCDVGAPPLPPASTVMLGLLDVVANLQLLSHAAVRSGLPASAATSLDSKRHSSTPHAATNFKACWGAETALPKDGVAHVTAGAATPAVLAAEAFNSAAASAWPDLYYDLSIKHTSHLNVPLRTEAYYMAPDSADSGGGPSAVAISSFQTISEGMRGLLCGVPFLRRLLLPLLGPSAGSSASCSADCSATPPQLDLAPSVHRGGSTFIFNHKALQIPQHAFPARRSDMLWCLAANCQGMKVLRCRQLAVLHERSSANTTSGCNANSSSRDAAAATAAALEPTSFFQGLILDIQGHSLYKALQAGLKDLAEAAMHTHGRPLPDISHGVLAELAPEQLLPALREFRLNRATAFAAAFRRIQGLVVQLYGLLHDKTEHWWFHCPEVAPQLASMQQQLEHLQHLYTLDSLTDVWTTLVDDKEQRLKEDLVNLSKVTAQLTSQHEVAGTAGKSVCDWVAASRKEYAQHLIPALLAGQLGVDSKEAEDSEARAAAAAIGEHGLMCSTELQFLGSGQEGLVFTDQKQLYKLCLWGTALQRCPNQLKSLQQLQSSPDGVDGSNVSGTQLPVHAVHKAEQWGPQWLLSYGPHKPGVVLTQLMHDKSHLALYNSYMCSGTQLLSLARRCVAAPLICCNVHPKNILLVQPESTSTTAAMATEMSAPGNHREGPGTGSCDGAGQTVASDHGDSYLLLLDLGCDWVPANPFNMISMLSRLYLCWRWWRRQDLPQLMTHATQLLKSQLEKIAPGMAAPAEDCPSNNSSTGGTMQNPAQQLREWLHHHCKEVHASTTAAANSKARLPTAAQPRPPAPGFDILWLTEELPELAGFARFAAAALGCYDNAKDHLDEELLSVATEMLQQMLGAESTGTVLDYGCGPKAQLLRQLQHRLETAPSLAQQVELIGADPCCSGEQDTKVCTSTLAQSSSVTLQVTSDCDWAASGAGGVAADGYDLVICSLVLCTIPDRQEYDPVLDNLAAAVKSGSGRLLLATCNPYFTLHGSTPFQKRSISLHQRYHSVFTWQKQLQQKQGQRLVCRDDVHRPVDALLHDLARRGLSLDWLHQTPSVNLDRPDEFSSDFLVLSFLPTAAANPQKPITHSSGKETCSPASLWTPVSCLIKVCAQEHRDIEWLLPDLVARVDTADYPVSEVMVVVDPHQGPFLRQLSTLATSGSGMLAELLDKLEGLKSLGWVDRILVADSVGSQAVQDANFKWFGLDRCNQTHAASGVSTTPTLQGLEACSHDVILQLDADLMFTARPYKQWSDAPQFISTHARHGSSSSRQCVSTLQLLASALLEDHLAISISMPSLPVAPATGASSICAPEANAAAAGGQSFAAAWINPQSGKPWRTEVRGCLLHRKRLGQLLPLPCCGKAKDNALHPPTWYRALDAAVEASGGGLRTYRAHIVQSDSHHGSITPNLEIAAKYSAEQHRSKHHLVASLAFLHPPNQPVKESNWGYSLVRSALRSECWHKEQPGKVDVIPGDAMCTTTNSCNSLRVAPDTPASSADRPGATSLAGDPCCNVSFVSSIAQFWALPHRSEPLVVVVCGRDVAPGRYQRCLESLLVQDWQEWGLVLMDDCSLDTSCVAYQEALLQYGIPQAMLSRVTHFSWKGTKRGMLFNDVVAIRHVCSNPDSVIVTLDADDMLLRHDALRSIMTLHQQGHDFVVGGHVRTDKVKAGAGYNTAPHCVTFAGPSRQRLLRGGGKVWQHCRSFRKRLFDAVPDDQLRMHKEPSTHQTTAGAPPRQLDPPTSSAAASGVRAAEEQTACGPGDVGYYYELANDWALTVPMAELAEAPCVLGKAVYLYEPSWPRSDRLLREAVIDTIMTRPPITSVICSQWRVPLEAVRYPHATTTSTDISIESNPRKVIAVVGDSNLHAAKMKADRVAGDEAMKQQLAEQVGRFLVDAGYRVMTGGLGGVMSAALRGAKSSTSYLEGDTIAVIPGDDPKTANMYADIVISTGLGQYRNGIVGRADGVIAIGGGAGTLQEVAVAWSAKRPVVVLGGVSGVGRLIAGCRIDGRGARDRNTVLEATDAAQAIQLLTTAMPGNP